MPPIIRSDTPYPLRTIDGSVDVSADNLLVTGDATFLGTVNIPGGVPVGPQPYYDATDTTKQYRTSQLNMDFLTTSATPNFNFKNVTESTADTQLYAGRIDLTSTSSTPVLSVQKNLDNTVTSTAGFSATCNTASIIAEVGGTANASIGNRGVVRSASTAGLDMNAAGAAKTVRLMTNTLNRFQVTDTLATSITPFAVADTTQSTSAITGSVVLQGGMGVTKNIYSDGTVHGAALEVGYAQPIKLPDSYTFTKMMDVQYNAPLSEDSTYIYTPGTSVTTASNDYVLGVNKLGMRIPATTESTTTTTGAVVIDGGVGVVKNLNVGGTLNAATLSITNMDAVTIDATGTVPATDYSTGTVTVAGGISSQDTVVVKNHILKDQVYAFEKPGSQAVSMNLKSAINNKRVPSGDVKESMVMSTSATASAQSTTGFAWAPEIGIGVKVNYTGAGNRAESTVDGINWIQQSATDHAWYSVCWSPELVLFAAVAGDGSVMTSPDGITWTDRTSPTVNELRSICWSPELGLFAAVAITGVLDRIITSPDGINWTVRSAPSSNLWFGVCWSPEQRIFCSVAVSGASDRVMTSIDGITWVSHPASVGNDWRDVCWSAELGLFAAVAGTGTGDRVMTSPDGIAWTTRTSPFDNLWYSITWSKDLSVFVSSAITNVGSNSLMYSFDGITWVIVTAPVPGGLSKVTWCNQLGRFIILDDTQATAVLSKLVLPSNKGTLNVSEAHVDATPAGVLQVKSQIAATNTTTGSLTVDGGAGITGDLYAGNLTGSTLSLTTGYTSFTPTFDTNIAITYTDQQGYTYKVGALTFVTILITTTSAIDNTNSPLTVLGIPHTLTGDLGAFGSCVLDNYAIGVSTDFVVPVIQLANPNQIVFQQSRDGLAVTFVESPQTAASRTTAATIVYLS